VIGLSSALAAVVVTILVLVAFGALGGRHRSALPPPIVTSPGDVVDYAVAERVGTAVAASVVTVRAKTATSDGPVGGGVVVSSDRVVTAAHNIMGADALTVVTTAGEEIPAKVVGSDAQTDLALLSVSGSDLKLAQFGASGPPRVGQTVIAISPGPNYHHTVSINVVSDRDVMVDAGTGVSVAGLLETGITTTQAMAGGALVDANGNLVGVLTRSTTGSDVLAVPVATVRDVQDQLESSGKVAHGWMGVVCEKDPAPHPAQGGATLQVVLPDSPASEAGLASGDVVVRAAGRLVSGQPDLIAAVRGLKPQDPLEVQYVRDGHTHNATVTLKAADPQLFVYAPAMG
jgi:S1-C subfamily serine protease